MTIILSMIPAVLIWMSYFLCVLFVLFAIGFALRIFLRRVNANLLSLMGTEIFIWMCFYKKWISQSVFERPFDTFFTLNEIAPLFSIFLLCIHFIILLVVPFIFVRFGIQKADDWALRGAGVTSAIRHIMQNRQR